MLLLISLWTRPGLVPSGTNHNLPQIYLALAHKDIDIAKCRQLHLQLQSRHALASSKPSSSNRSSCEIKPKSRVKNSCPVPPGRSTITHPDMTSYEGVSCVHAMMQRFAGWTKSWLILSLGWLPVPRHFLMPRQAVLQN